MPGGLHEQTKVFETERGVDLNKSIKTKQVKKLFGTDGIRGLANQGPLDVEQVLALGEHTARLLHRQRHRVPRVGIGWDTRVSSPALAAALTAGLASGGAEVFSFGILTTPAVAYLTRHFHLDAGIVISASHNPAEDNGIKYFSAQGTKLPDQTEYQLEHLVLQNREMKKRTGTLMGKIQNGSDEAVQAYISALVKRFQSARLAGLRVAVDLANGAPCRTVPMVFQALKMKAIYFSQTPDGKNINAQCGSLHPQKVSWQVRKTKAQAGLAFDGDGDRVILTDEKGATVNGDRILGLLAREYARRGRLKARTVVATVMSNLGLELFLKQQGIRLLRTQVGDRYVSEAMARGGYQLGGEQSGHILLPHYASTGDGLLTALEVLAVMQAKSRPFSELVNGWSDFPQLLINIPVARKPELMLLASVKQVVRQAVRALGERGRVNLRYSGTEPLVRVMVEAEIEETVKQWAELIADAVAQAIGNGQPRRITWLTCA